MRKSARNDKRSYVEGLAAEAESAAARGELNIVYKITKRLCGNYTSHSALVKGKYGSTIITEREQADIWVEYFCEVLNHPQPDESADPPPMPDDLNIDTSPPTKAEVRNAIKAMKREKAPGVDSIHAEMLKADLSAATRVLTNLFDTILDKETIPSDWGKGLNVKISKKGNLQVCENWRGITFLSISSKEFCRSLLERIETAIDKKMRQEQAGFSEEKRVH